jgi:two-component system cell cycle response regulator DivK
LFKTALGLEAVRIASDNQPDLVLLDIQLPDISGFELARRLKADVATQSIPILAVTAFAMRGDRERVLESGCDGYIAKPVNIVELLRTIETYFAP